MKRLKQLIAKLRAETGVKFAAAATLSARPAPSIDAGHS